MLEDVLNMFSIVAIAWNCTPVWIHFQGVVNRRRSRQAHPLTICDCSSFTTIPQQLTRVCDNDTTSATCPWNLAYSCDKVDSRALVDSIVADDTVREDAKVLMTFTKDNDDTLLLLKILCDQY